MTDNMKEAWMDLMLLPFKSNEFKINLKDVYHFAFDSYEDAIITLKTEKSDNEGLLYQLGIDYKESNGDYWFTKESLEWFMAGNNRAMFDMYRMALAAWDKCDMKGGIN